MNLEWTHWIYFTILSAFNWRKSLGRDHFSKKYCLYRLLSLSWCKLDKTPRKFLLKNLDSVLKSLAKDIFCTYRNNVSPNETHRRILVPPHNSFCQNIINDVSNHSLPHKTHRFHLTLNPSQKITIACQNNSKLDI